MSQHFVESTLRGFARAMGNALSSEQTAAKRGLLQGLDPRARIIGIFALVLTVTLCRKLEAVALLLFAAVVIALASRVSPATLIKRVWLIVFGFTGFIALPAIFITPGDPIGSLRPLTITAQGARTAALLILRVETAVTLTTALVLSTPWTQILRGLRSLCVPAEVITMLAMTHRYIFLLIETANQMFESRQSRMVGELSGTEQRRMAARTAGVLLTKSMDLSGDVYLAMQSRGFSGDIRLLSDTRMQFLDIVAIALVICAATATAWMGR
jgi:cobalt/nickel transport system permease protein